MVSLEIGRNFWFGSFLIVSCSFNYKKKAGWRNGRMAEWQNGRMAGQQNGRMADWQDSRMAEWQNMIKRVNISASIL